MLRKINLGNKSKLLLVYNIIETPAYLNTSSGDIVGGISLHSFI